MYIVPGVTNVLHAGRDINIANIIQTVSIPDSTMQMAHRLLHAIIEQPPHMPDLRATFESGLSAGASESNLEEQVTGNSVDDSDASPSGGKWNASES